MAKRRAASGGGGLSYCKVHYSTLKETFQMQLNKLARIFLAAALGCSTLGFAQNDSGAKQDAKDVGHDTKKAAVATGHGTEKVADKTAHGTKVVAKDTAHGTKVAAKDTAHGTKVAAKGTAHGVKKIGKKIAGKPEPQN
jgi:DNA polymerase II small subunit/DNA polymerase delta subunit B